MSEPLHTYWVVGKHVLRYLHGTINLGLRYIVRDVILHRHTNVEWDGNVIASKSTLGFFLG